MSSKRCFKCLREKPVDGFYKHSAMSGGRLNKCKECTKADVKAHRAANLNRIREYDKARASQPERVAARQAYAMTPEGKAAHRRALLAATARSPERRAARIKLGNAVRDAKVVPLNCEVCGGDKVEGHHPHYGAPLAVVWLCNKHHRQVHKETEQLAA